MCTHGGLIASLFRCIANSFALLLTRSPFHVSPTSFVCLDYLYSGYPDDLLVLAIPLVVKLWRDVGWVAENSAGLTLPRNLASFPANFEKIPWAGLKFWRQHGN